MGASIPPSTYDPPGMAAAPTQVDGLELVEVADGFIVYDEARERVHFLNHTAAVVLTLCDGSKPDAEIATLVQQCYELPETPQEEIAACLERFRTEGLVR